FDEAEDEAEATKRKMTKLVHGLEAGVEDDDDEIENQITSIMKSKTRVVEAKKGSQGPTTHANLGALEKAKMLAQKISQDKNLTGVVERDAASRTAEAVMRGGEAAPVTISAKAVAQQLAEQLNEKLNYIPSELHPGVDTEQDVQYFEEELEINDFPQQVRWRVCSRECIGQVQEYADVGISVKGSFYPPNKEPKDDDRKLFLFIEARSELALTRAKTEVIRIMKDSLRQLASQARTGGQQARVLCFTRRFGPLVAVDMADTVGGASGAGGTRSLSRSGSLKKEKKDDSFLDKITTLGRGKKKQVDEDEAKALDMEGREAIDSSGIPVPVNMLPENLHMEEGEERRLVAPESRDDPRVKEIISLLIDWINDELADQRIIVKDIQEDIFDGQVIQKLLEKFTGVKIEVPEVSQSEEGQRQKMRVVVTTANKILAQPQYQTPKWTPEWIHGKDLIAILQLLIALAIHFRAPIRFPEYVKAQLLLVQKRDGQLKTRYATEELTTSQTELGLKGERDAFDTLFDYGPDKLAHVKSSLVSFCNKHLNKINLEVTDLETQFQDGVFMVLMMGLLEGYFVPLYSFHLQVSTHQQKVQNVAFAFELMQDAGLQRPRTRPEDIANGDLKSTLRVLHSLFTKYKFV
uniref:Calponin-homology (CH) domain-containing protein n=1 Tax=Plectus sambesii TaxID=2011161 RepID=A0A914XQR4_9BILA